MNGYERRTEAKKQKIRTAALELFCVRGTEKTSVNEIALKAGVAPATIYNYFGSKEGLMKETIVSIIEDSWRARKELWETDLPFPELIKRAISMSEDFFDRTNLETIKALFDSDPEIKKLAEDFNRNSYPAIVGRFLEKGRSEGYIRKDISLEAATIYLKMYQDVLMQPGILKDQNKNLIKELVDLMIYGLAGQTLSKELENQWSGRAGAMSEIGSGDMRETEGTVRIFVENEAGSNLKRRYDERSLELLSTSALLAPYPHPYGFVIGTVGEEGDALDCYVLGGASLTAGSIAEARVVGLLEMLEGGEVDHKVLVALPGTEPRVDEALRVELRDFITKIFKAFPEVEVEIGRILGEAEARGFVARHRTPPAEA